ncbi:putative Protein AATF [Hypsibius exemplaris]|uniref:AATF leucine zipper-containing domain-containing protein n=1 Tax=Hypsibius exemplaris TaxID=2072580 RepID=A0A9X6NCF7_HYPEX|nr:putative Protein AATF [Hypsibius exemplaris]
MSSDEEFSEDSADVAEGEDEDEEQNDDDNEDNEDEEDEEDEDDDGDDEEEDHDEESSGAGVRHFSTSAAARNKDSENGEAVRKQLEIWDGLLEMRIKLQKPMTVCNLLPEASLFGNFIDAVPEETGETVEKAREDLRTLLGDLAGLQDLLAKNNPALSSKSAGEGDNEEIPSDSDDENEMDSQLPDNELADPGLTLDKIDALLEKRFRKMEPFRDSTLEKWSSKTRQFSVGMKKNFSAFDQSPVKQITQVMSDKQRLLQRTQTPRTVYRVLGSVGSACSPLDATVTGEKAGTTNTTQLNPEIFDDDDFYHVLLRELIERKTGDVSDPIELSRQQIQLVSWRRNSRVLSRNKPGMTFISRYSGNCNGEMSPLTRMRVKLPNGESAC